MPPSSPAPALSAAPAGRPTRPRRKPAPKVERVAVPCCSCGEPTGMKVPKALADEVEVVELCKACVRKL